METQFIIAITLGLTFLFVCIFVVFFFRWRNNKIDVKNKKNGNEAEIKVNKIMKSWALNNNSKYLENSLYKYENKLFEVDGILVTSWALIVIEVKSINGIIEGNSTEENWTKVLGTKRHEIKSPIVQNERHISHILNVIKTKVPILSFIVFDDRTEEIKVENRPSHVLINKIDKIEKDLDFVSKQLIPKINNNEIHHIYNSLLKASTKSRHDKNRFKTFFKK